MDYGAWSFVRGAERLEIRRRTVDTGVTLEIAGGGEPRAIVFRDFAQLEIFQKDMETLLLKTGWSFAAFAPDRRTGIDRRGWPRRANDRRRWWTDSRITKTVTPGEELRKIEEDRTSPLTTEK